jgi:hypothetical protein
LLHAQGASASALSCGESVMLLRVAENIRQCLDNAAEARQRAQDAIDSERKAHFLDMERRWIRLAESYRLVEQLGASITDPSRRPEEEVGRL